MLKLASRSALEVEEGAAEVVDLAHPVEAVVDAAEHLEAGDPEGVLAAQEAVEAELGEPAEARAPEERKAARVVGLVREEEEAGRREEAGEFTGRQRIRIQTTTTIR